jgi:hypothetical protein
MRGWWFGEGASTPGIPPEMPNMHKKARGIQPRVFA